MAKSKPLRGMNVIPEEMSFHAVPSGGHCEIRDNVDLGDCSEMPEIEIEIVPFLEVGPVECLKQVWVNGQPLYSEESALGREQDEQGEAR